MKRAGSVLKQDFIKMCTGSTMPLAVLIAYVLLASAYIYIDVSNGKAFSILTLMVDSKSKASVIQQGDLHAAAIFLGQSNGYIWMFAPIVTALPFISSVCAGYADTNFRFEIMRTGKTALITGRILACMLTGGMILSGGQLLYGFTLWGVLGERIILNKPVMCKLAAVFLYGAVSTLMVVFLSAFVRNKYLTLSVPFMLHYIYHMLFMSLINKSIFGGKSTVLLTHLLVWSERQDIYLYDMYEKAGIIFFDSLVTLCAILVHQFVIDRRVDCGMSK